MNLTMKQMERAQGICEGIASRSQSIFLSFIIIIIQLSNLNIFLYLATTTLGTTTTGISS